MEIKEQAKKRRTLLPSLLNEDRESAKSPSSSPLPRQLDSLLGPLHPGLVARPREPKASTCTCRSVQCGKRYVSVTTRQANRSKQQIRQGIETHPVSPNGLIWMLSGKPSSIISLFIIAACNSLAFFVRRDMEETVAIVDSFTSENEQIERAETDSGVSRGKEVSTS
jgi:hypothetical protein